MKNDLTWRLEDIAHSLQAEVRGERLYGLDEWSTPIVNLKKAADAATNLVAQRDALLAACERVSALHPADCILIEVIQVREAIARARGAK